MKFKKTGLICGCVLLGLMAVAADLDGDGLSDFDETTFYQTNPALPDTDGDGVNDFDEVKSGTDPNEPSSVFWISDLEIVSNGVALSFPGQAGRTYAVSRKDSLLSTNDWVVIQSRIEGVDGMIMLVDTNAPMGADTGFYLAEAKLGQPGWITRDVWTGIPGFDMPGLITNVNYPDNPSFTEMLSGFEAPVNWGDDYGQRLYGFIHPPVTTNYTFWIAGDNRGELWLSSNADPANVSKIAYTYATEFQEWDKAAAQQSAPVALVAGRKYFVEVLHKEATGADHISVAWDWGGGTNLIGSEYLSEPGSQTPPVSRADAYLTEKNQELAVAAAGVLLNDVDAEDDAMTVYMVSNAVSGLVDLNQNGAFSYTPEQGFSGSDHFTYKAFDAVAGGNVATVNIVVDNGAPPVAEADAYSTPYGVTLNISAPGVLENDSDPDDDVLTVVSAPVLDVNNGMLTLSTNGSFTYVPAPGFSGADYFTYRVSDGATSDVATVSLTVGPPVPDHVDVISNGDFEIGTAVADKSGAGFDASPWERHLLSNTNSWVTDDSFDPIVGTGNQCVEFAWGGTYIYQDFTAVAGKEYTFDCDSLQLSGNTIYVPTLQVRWYDSSTNLIGSTLSVASVAAAGTGPNAEVWVAMNGVQIAPANTSFGRVQVILELNPSGTRKYCYFDNVSVTTAGELALGTQSELDVWDYESTGAASLVAVSQVAGHYAVADRESDRVEIRDISGTLIAEVTSSDILAAAGDLDLSGVYGPCSMAFTPSGRLLYLGVCSATGSGDKDAILLYNLNLDSLTVFDRLVIDVSMTEPVNYGMAHYQTSLFVGTEENLYRYAAGRNDTGSEPSETVETGSAVTGLAVDMAERTGTNWTAKLYVSTPSDLYRVDPSVALSLSSSIASSTNIKGLTFGRTYGGPNTAGLYILRSDGSSRLLELVPTAALRAGGSVTPVSYAELGSDLSDIAATACGRILLATASPQILSDASDARLDFMAWVQDEFDNYADAVKTLNWPDGLVPEGFNVQRLVPAGTALSKLIDVDTSGWAMYCMLAASLVNEDTEVEEMIVKMLKRNAGAYPDGLGGVKTVDGVLYDTYDSSGNLTATDGTLYTMMKLLPAAYRAKDVFPANAEIAAYQDYFRSIMKRSSDSMRADMRLTWRADDHGPLDQNNVANNETWIMADIAAAQDPICSQSYEQYLYDVNDITHPSTGDYLTNELVLADSHSAFIGMGGSMILQHHRDLPGWETQNKNYYATSIAVGDELGAPYVTAFSAGHSPWSGGYNADGPTDHPGDVIHFPAVCGLGQYGWSSPVVGAYLAYRDGLRQEMQSSANYSNPQMLTRWSMQDPTYVMTGVGIADFWFGMIGLGEVLHPGLTDYLADDYYMPAPIQSVTTNGQIKLVYSKIAPRRILGSDDGTSFVSFGFQFSPFEFDLGVTYSNYYVEDAEGTLLDLSNADFENGLTGWMQEGSDQFYSPSNTEVHIVGVSAEIRSSITSTLAESSLSQTVDLSLDLENTRYIVRADGASVFADPAGNSYLRVMWDNDANVTNGVISTNESSRVGAGQERVEFRVDASKPAGAGYMHIFLVMEPGAAVENRYIFDNVSMVRLGAAVLLANGDFESGDFSGWTESSDSINTTSDPAKVIQGDCSARYTLDAGETDWQSLYRTVDLSGDPLGTRYIFRFSAEALTMMDSDFEVMADIYDSTNAVVVTRFGLSDVIPSTAGEVSFTLRKRPEYDHAVFQFRMKRLGGEPSGTDEIIIDNFRLDKERLF